MMDNTMIDYEIVSVNETKIMDVFEHKYESSEDKEWFLSCVFTLPYAIKIDWICLMYR